MQDWYKHFQNKLFLNDLEWLEGTGVFLDKLVSNSIERLPGFHTTAREPKRAHLRVPAFKNTTKIQREDPQRERERKKKRAKMGAGEGKKREILGGPAEEMKKKIVKKK